MSSRKIPGMLYIFVSFTPWIIYWVLCSAGYELGILLSLLFSAVLVVFQALKKEYSLMDVVSLTYFSIAAMTTFIQGSSIFVEKDGTLGYFTLFLMAAFSLVIRKPFTLQVSKRDYPKIYWNTKPFLLVNTLITGVWATIFLVNTIVYLIIANPFSTILSNILVVSGIVFSILFPLKAPAYCASKEFKKYDWKVETKKGVHRGEQNYDVIVVGSGIGGLTCGALLAKGGFRVLVLEYHYQVGGYCSSFIRKGFVFNTGVEDVSGLWEKGPVNYLLQQLGLRKEDLFVKNTVSYIYRNSRVEASNLREFIERLSQMFPREENNIRRFFNEAKEAYIECYKEADIYGVPLPAWLIVKVFGEKKLLEYPKEHPHFYDWMNKTYKEKLDEFFTDPDLKTFLCGLLGYIGTKPEETLASSALTAAVSYYLHGGYFPKGSAQNYANTLKEVIEEHGGTVLVKHKVDKIIVENKEVKGVVSHNKVFKAPIVVANANAKTVFLELIEEKHLGRKYVEYIKSLKMSPSCFMVFLGVDMDLSQYPTLLKNLDEGYEIVINSNADSSLAPPGKASLTIITGANYYDFPERGTPEYLEKKMKTAQLLIKKAEKLIPGLSKHIVVLDAATPKTFERYTLMPEGAIYSFDQSIKTKRPYFKSPVKGLYLASASTFPGGGIEAVTIAGIICAHDICDWKL
ncbi:MAG: all-trans-retinol 13,14-reductase [Thermoprotei archaeon]|nr:MAG: all-trans-retinol 13,14-reductase [Thermoprotei archaeon]HDI75577.1 NAD(P)/FAD-dependent oxidoreductase [Thermoprotei archaeon]